MIRNLIFFLSGAILCTLFCFLRSIDQVGRDFFQLRFFEVMQLLIGSGIGLFIAFYVSKRVTERLRRDERRGEILNDIIGNIFEKVGEAYRLSNSYIADPNSETKNGVLSMLTLASQEISLLIEIPIEFFAEKAIDSRNIKMKWIGFKKAVTDTPFGDPNPDFNEERRRIIDKAYGMLRRTIIGTRFELYS